jgi:hypothetical protein
MVTKAPATHGVTVVEIARGLGDGATSCTRASTARRAKRRARRRTSASADQGIGAEPPCILAAIG